MGKPETYPWDDIARSAAAAAGLKVGGVLPPSERARLRAERDRIDCPDCNGSGERIINPDWPSGTEPYSEKCSTCGGTGIDPGVE